MGNRVYRRKTKRKKWQLVLIPLLLAALVLSFIWLVLPMLQNSKVDRLARASVPNWIDVQIIDVDGAARRGVELEELNSIVIHYIGNPGTTAQQNRDYFNSAGSEVSAHFVVGLNGEIIQCVPLDEKSSASNERNRDTISIEVCHPDETGAFTQASYDSLIRLVAWICDASGLDETDIIRHYDVTGKICPKYYVEHEDAWEQLKRDVGNSL